MDARNAGIKARMLAERDAMLRRRDAIENQVAGIERAMEICAEVEAEFADAALAAVDEPDA